MIDLRHPLRRFLGTLTIANALILSSAAIGNANDSPPAQWPDSIVCEGDYQHHLQGVCVDRHAQVYWSFTTQLVKTDSQGRVLKQLAVPNHHGDLCILGDQIYVAVNLGLFNDPAGNADSWVYVYDAKTLDLVSKHEVQEVFHGAGGIGVREGHFFVVGGLPDGVQENYVYEYDASFRFLKKHVIDSKWTHLGIQTATFHDGQWWFGCYGTPKILLTTDADFKLRGRFEFDCSLGVVGVSPREGAASGKILFAKGPRTSDGRHLGSLHAARPDPQVGLVEVDPPTEVEE
ncbi:hypothetical protein [Aureliella helgolandensis]|uniref:SMP-30/Gluconolaconase/LRE-like region n=1 Tax=Aureliella helgolandensis TaxID=2527968 RepID=A0A518GA54_9BACT|nr:hypothetical protein [Aureliella helgolandensis]QDV25475.1 hypothetical protein Q31a_38010 [Aureliella helgolandensis]